MVTDEDSLIHYTELVKVTTVEPRFNGPWRHQHVAQQSPSRAEECSTVVGYSFQVETSKGANATRNTVVVEHRSQIKQLATRLTHM